MPSRQPTPGSRGIIAPIGGAEDKHLDRVILRRFVDLCGNGDSRIVVIPTASQLDDTGDRYVRIFDGLGAGQIDVLPMKERADADADAAVELLEQASGIFFTGGNQLRLSTTLGGTAVATVVRRLNARGVHVAGTSAGAAFVSEHMIAYGAGGLTPVAGKVTLCAGLGLTNRVIVDQHFRQRGRLGRLLTALSYNPFAVGIGLDEDTAAFIDADNRLEVVGAGAITIVDVSDLEYSSMADLDEGDAVDLIGVRLHVLSHGGTYDLGTRKASPGGRRSES